MADVKTVSVITLHRVKNYGSVLQTYATQRILEDLGWVVEFVDYWRPSNVDEQRTEWNLARSQWNSNALARAVYRTVYKPLHQHEMRVFNGFLRRHINTSSRSYYSIAELRDDPPIASLYCTGSDQVWNSIHNEGVSEPFLLSWVPNGKPKISLSSSFGNESLEEAEKSSYQELLRDYRDISVREDTAVRIVADLGLSAVQLVDPVLGMHRENWLSLASTETESAEYLLLYQLYRNDQLLSYAERAARSMGLKLVRIGLRPEDRWARTIFKPEVEEFVSLFRNASFVVTDSFHGASFSLIFNRPFSVLTPSRHGTRVTSLLNLTDTSDRAINDWNRLPRTSSVDFQGVNHILDRERQRMSEFLGEALKR